MGWQRFRQACEVPIAWLSKSLQAHLFVGFKTAGIVAVVGWAGKCERIFIRDTPEELESLGTVHCGARAAPALGKVHGAPASRAPEFRDYFFSGSCGRRSHQRRGAKSFCRAEV
jgi:hypothetical protein